MNNENNLILAMAALAAIATETVSIGKSIDTINERIAVIKGLGYHSIQSGLGSPYGPIEVVQGELPDKSLRAAVIDQFAGKTGRLLTESLRDLRQSINYGLETGKILTDSKISRVKKNERAAKNAPTVVIFDAVKISTWLSGKYTKKQISALIVELEKLIA